MMMSFETGLAMNFRARFRILLFVVLAMGAVLGLSVLLRGLLTQARADLPGGVVFSENYRLSTVYTGDLVVASPAITLDETARVTGNVSFAGESIMLAGTIAGDLTLLAQHIILDGVTITGNLRLLSDDALINAQIDGTTMIDVDVLHIGEGARFASAPAVCADRVTDDRAEPSPYAPCPPATIDPFRDLIPLRAQLDNPISLSIRDPLTLGLGAGVFTALVALCAALVPARLVTVVRMVRHNPLRCLQLGIVLLALVIGMVSAQIFLLGTITALGVVLLPVSVVGSVAVGLIVLLGVATTAILLGGWLLRKPQPPMIAAAVGGAGIALVLVGVALLPYGQIALVVAVLAISAAGVGAVVYTRAGTSGRAA